MDWEFHTQLLSGGEELLIAEEENKQKEIRTRDLVFGLLDLSVALFFFVRERGIIFFVGEPPNGIANFPLRE